jgi:pimeloyl-ACP methyl ester carboxylesterase
MATYVLVHGAWHGGWCWQRVTPLLHAAGHEVFTPTLTGLGERSHLAGPKIDLNTHIQDVVNVLEYEDLRKVILVGHSYGGMVITGVTERAADRLAHVVYLDAFVPQNGQALVDLVAPQFREGMQQQAQAADGLLPPFPVEQYGVFADADVRWVGAKLVPHPFKTLTTAVRLTTPAAAALPRTYIYCNNPAMGFFEAFAERTKAGKGWRYRELATGHDAMVTMPRELTDLLLEIV